MPARVQSVARAAALLDAMASGRWIALRELAQHAGIAKATACNLVGTLTDLGLVERDSARGTYRLGLTHLVYGRAVERRMDMVEVVRPYLVRLCAETRETVNLALPCATDAIIVESLESNQTLRVSAYAGTRAEYHATACGRALIAWRSEAFRQTIFDLGPLHAKTAHTTTDPTSLHALLEHCRNEGWVSEFEENELGSACVAAPIFDTAQQPLASVSIAGPASRFTPQAMRGFGALLVRRMPEISTALQRAAQTPRQPAAPGG